MMKLATSLYRVELSTLYLQYTCDGYKYIFPDSIYDFGSPPLSRLPQINFRIYKKVSAAKNTFPLLAINLLMSFLLINSASNYLNLHTFLMALNGFLTQ